MVHRAKMRRGNRQSQHAKRKRKRKSSVRQANTVEEQTEVSAKDIVEKTLGCLTRLGSQIFALSPFSQYFDPWLVNLRQITFEFESNPAIKADEQFVKERTQIFLDVEAALAEKRIQEGKPRPAKPKNWSTTIIFWWKPTKNTRRKHGS